jgi:hypothetical protein
MAEPNAPYYVSFSTDAIPTTVDHTSSNPGPAGSSANRAGFTSIRVSAEGGPRFARYTGAARADGLVPFYYQSINVLFSLKDFIVKISSDYPVNSCAYNATNRHEFDAHLYRPIRIFLSYRDIVIGALNGISVPTQPHPRWVRPTEVTALQENFEQQVNEAVSNIYRNLRMAIRAARDAEDDPSHYQLVYDQCSPAQW